MTGVVSSSLYFLVILFLGYTSLSRSFVLFSLLPRLLSVSHFKHTLFSSESRLFFSRLAWYCITFCPSFFLPSLPVVRYPSFATASFLSFFLPHSSLSSSSIPSLMSGSDWTISSFIVVFDLFLIPSLLSLVLFSFLILAFCPLMESLCLTRISFVVVILLHCYSCWSLVLFFVSFFL